MATDGSDPAAPPVADAAPAAPVEEKPVEAVTAPADGVPAEEKPAEVATTASEAKPAEEKPAEAKTVEEKPAEAKAVEEKPAEAKPAEPVAAAEAPATEPIAKPVESAASPPDNAVAIAVTPGANVVQIDLVGRTDVGLIREHNEDNFTCVQIDDANRDLDSLRKHTLGPRGTLLLVCDGMGGAAAGEVASSMAVATVPEVMLGDRTAAPPAGVVEDAGVALARKLRFATEEANRRIFAEQQANIARSGMGTTMTAAYLRGDRATIAQVGDSRCYVQRAGKLTQVTRDQSLVNQLLETGQITAEQAKYFEHSNVILQALGVQDEVEVQLSRVELRRGDRIMLCSDGLVGVVADEEIAAVLGSVDDPNDAARVLIELANGAGGPDNITVIVAYLSGEGLQAPTDTDVIEYATWHIDPVPSTPVELESFAPTEAAPTNELPQVTSPQPPPAPSLRPLELFSMATIVALIVGSFLVGATMYSSAIQCRVRAARAGLVVMADGRDSGARTIEGEVPLRLAPGRHQIALADQHGKVLLSDPRELEVRAGEACVIAFDDNTSAALDDSTPAVAAPAPAESAH